LKSFFKTHHRTIFYTSWFLLGLVQSIFTELQDDEAYYWMFSQYLDWGYFDHPPMIAVLIKTGATFLSGELAVRIAPLILSSVTIFITEKLTANKNPFLFYAIALSIAVLQISGFVAVPDVPLMFFTALLFLVYKNYLQKPSWFNALLIGLIASCLLYSKYHGVLVLFFILLSNFKLLRDGKMYVAALFALVLFLPHLYWQYHHNWISFRYHLFESNVNPYKFSYTIDYILGQLLLAGPIAGFILWPSSFLYRAKNVLERAMKFVVVGFVVFFLLSTLKGKVEPNWTSPAIIPVIVLAHQYLLGNTAWRKWLFRLLPVTVLLVIVFRAAMIVNFIPAQAIVERYHGWKNWPKELHQRTKGVPVVFNNSYQRASKWSFYTGDVTYSLNMVEERRNNYNFWPIEDSLLGKPVYIMDIYGINRFQDSIQTPLYTIGYRYDSSYNSFAKIIFKSGNLVGNSTDSLKINFSVDISPYYKNYLVNHPEINPGIVISIFDGQKMIQQLTLPFLLQDAIKKEPGNVVLAHELHKGNYFIRFGVMSDSGLYTHNSDKIKLELQ
jgi:hypothetical protein